MITEKQCDELTVQTEVSIVMDSVQIVQKQIENEGVKKTSVVFLNETEMDVLFEEYQSPEARLYFKRCLKCGEKLPKDTELTMCLNCAKSILKLSLKHI